MSEQYVYHPDVLLHARVVLESMDDRRPVPQESEDVVRAFYAMRGGAAALRSGCMGILFGPRPSAPRPARDPSIVDHPDHHGGGDNPYRAIKVIEQSTTEAPAP